MQTDWDVRRFDRWSGRYDRSVFQPLFFRRVHLWVTKTLSPAAGERILDVGCGTGRLAARLASLCGRVVGVDPAVGMITQAAAKRDGGMTFAAAAAENLPFADAAFDAAVTAVSAHHWQDAAAGISELHRVVRAGGRIVVADVARLGLVLDALRRVFFRKVEHHRGWEPKELADLLYAAGFRRVRARRERVLGAPVVILAAER